MDPIEPILPHPTILSEVRAAQRGAPIHRDGRGGGGGGAYRQPQRRRSEQEAVEIDIEGVDDTLELRSANSLQLPTPRLIDVTDDAEPAPPTHRVDLSA